MPGNFTQVFYVEHFGRREIVGLVEEFPQGLKPDGLIDPIGTTEVVPCYKALWARVLHPSGLFHVEQFGVLRTFDPGFARGEVMGFDGLLYVEQFCVSGARRFGPEFSLEE
jgi:hypothetical protein